jgi:hypothetical protein
MSKEEAPKGVGRFFYISRAVCGEAALYFV